jgi:hypothetical protein
MASPNCKTEAEDYNWIQTGAKDFESNCKQAQTHASLFWAPPSPQVRGDDDNGFLICHTQDATTKKMTNSMAELVPPRVAVLFSYI